MGRQSVFQLVPEDRTAFLSFVQQRDPVIVTNFTDSSSADVHPVDLERPNPGYREWLCLWNQALLSSLRREHIPKSNIGPYYRIDSALPILEFSVPVQGVWDDKPALTQGRLYAYAYQDHPDLRAWYEALARWLRTRFKRNPISWMSGYVGPEAYRWHQSGGLLLPFLPPPVNAEWRQRIHGQHW